MTEGFQSPLLAYARLPPLQGGQVCRNQNASATQKCDVNISSNKSRKGFRAKALKPMVYQLKTISLFELIDTSTGINQLLLAREEGMAVAANIYLQNVAFFRRTSFERSSTSASNSYFVIFGMNISFHYFHLAVNFLSICFPIIQLFFPFVNCFCANL